MPDLFLSYAHEDREVSAALAGELARLGVDVWWDHNLLAGDNYRNQIEEILGRTRLVIVVWSRRSVKSRWVIGEASNALERDCLIPVSIDGEKPPIDFHQLHAIELKEWMPGDPLPAELIRAVSGRLGRDLIYDEEARRAGAVSRLARQATSGWYLDFESLVIYLIGHGVACFLCEAPMPSLAKALRKKAAEPDADLGWVPWAPYALSVLIGVIIAALYMRPVLENRRLPVAFGLFAVAALIGVVDYQILVALSEGVPDQLLTFFGLNAFIFVLVTAVADRTIRRR
jgi:hypothetical protein